MASRAAVAQLVEHELPKLGVAGSNPVRRLPQPRPICSDRANRDNVRMRVTAKADYAVRAVVELAAGATGSPRKVDDVAQAQEIPLSFLENILTQLKTAGVVRSLRGPEGGYWLARPAEQISLAEVIRAVEGPLVGVRGQRPEEISYAGSAEPLQQVWVALRANLRAVLERVTVADVAFDHLPPSVTALTRDDDAWHAR
jgi:Rrf2 family protein